MGMAILLNLFLTETRQRDLSRSSWEEDQQNEHKSQEPVSFRWESTLRTRRKKGKNKPIQLQYQIQNSGTKKYNNI